MALICFITSLMIVAAAIAAFPKMGRGKAVSVLVASVLYAVFCFVAYGRMTGLIPTVSIEQIISQKGYDTSVLPMSVSAILNVGFLGASVFNLLTAAWVLLRWSFWKWCLSVAALFCIGGACTAPALGMSPLYSLFGACCGIMAAVGWVLGLTYIEFCVIGNIWIPGLAIMATAVWMTLEGSRTIGMSGGVSAVARIGAAIAIFTGLIQIVLMTALLWHYVGTWNYAFYTCVRDLRNIAAMFHTTYEAVNIVVYVFIAVGMLSCDVLAAKWLSRQRLIATA